MIEKSLRVLEYDKVIKMLESQAASKLGKEKCSDIRPLKSLKQINKLQEETKEASLLMNELGNPPLFGIFNLNEVLNYAKKGGVLAMGSLLDVSANLRVSSELKKYLSEKDEDVTLNLLEDMINRLSPEKNIQSEIERKIISANEMADDASPRLMSIRTSLTNKNIEIRNRINSIVSSNADYLQDNISTIRDGRHVVPVKSQYRNTFKGIVHDVSASGATVFIEPMAVVNVNNEIKILLEEEEEEIERILRLLTEKVADKAEIIQANQYILEDLDFIFARAKLSKKMDGVAPKLNKDGYIKLINARHPLIGEKVVPISLELGKDFTSLLITGPNTGGKTVSLKTVGLFTLMAMSGLHIPADMGSEIAIFDHIYADIGDEQSIEQSLSTFSSHMTNIVDILENITENSLVLFDELGAGTDPTEGSALAIAILEHLRRKNIRTIATTHYAELKVYALNTENVENASVEFNLDTLRPTYKLTVGTVGKSNAFEISKRLGIPIEIIKDAEYMISSENKSFEEALINIEEDRKTIANLKQEIARKEKDAKIIQKRLEEELSKAEKSKAKIIEGAKKEAAEILEEAKEKAQSSIRELNKIRKSSDKESIQRAHEIKSELDKSHKKYDEKDYSFLNVKATDTVEELKLGDEVKVLTMGQSGQVVELPDKQGNLVVEIGILKINTNINQIEKTKSKAAKGSQANIKNIIKNRMNKNIKTEIDIRGRNIEEARTELDLYLDDAYIAGLKEVRIIHGKGTGVLRKGVQDYLKSHRLIKSIKDGGYEDGGLGVTLAEIRE